MVLNDLAFLTLLQSAAYTGPERLPRMTQSLLAVSLAASLVALPGSADRAGGAGPQEPSRGTRTVDIYVSVLDGGAPVKDLGAGDFAVREDGNVREVLKAGPATEPLTISILVDDSQAADPVIHEMRRGLTAFVEQMQGRAQIAIATFGERPTAIVDYTESTEALKRGITKIFSRQGSGAYLLDAIVDVSRGLQKRETAARPVIIALTVEGVEFSTLYHEPVLEELRKSGAAFHALAIGTPSDSLVDEMRNRNLVLAQGTSRTGGRRDQVLANSALPERLEQLGNELLNQYVVTYARPESLIPPEDLDVTVKRPGVTVRAPKAAPAPK
jgi:VWFA-related protein